MNNIFTVILTGSVTAALTSGLISLITNHLDRQSARKAKLFDLAFNMAKERTALIMKVADTSGKTAYLKPDIFLAEEFYKWLQHMYDNGELPKEAHDSLVFPAS